MKLYGKDPEFFCAHCGRPIIIYADEMEEARKLPPEDLLHIACYNRLHPVVHPTSYRVQDGCWNCKHRGYWNRPVCHLGAAVDRHDTVSDNGICHAWSLKEKR